MAQIKTSFTKEEVEIAFQRLFAALHSGRLYRGSPKSATADPPLLIGLPRENGGFAEPTCGTEFMLMHSEAIPSNDTLGRPTRCVYAFKHSNTRNYIYVAMRGEHEVLVPVTPEPFHRGFF